jgi:hypothetical protein
VSESHPTPMGRTRTCHLRPMLIQLPGYRLHCKSSRAFAPPMPKQRWRAPAIEMRGF